ncbi:hypothetical protein K7X08_032710 [Anisodus acutangulus]|uniref:Uncharacterized protein n=1 Tax=Anisodus acutangulus TaxID=402998 RepID=A0A9Q1RBW5_9SOLA|nr:hypothetical protein K7X08_032710 [Anisodus acutangulus]
MHQKVESSKQSAGISGTGPETVNLKTRAIADIAKSGPIPMNSMPNVGGNSSSGTSSPIVNKSPPIEKNQGSVEDVIPISQEQVGAIVELGDKHKFKATIDKENVLDWVNVTCSQASEGRNSWADEVERVYTATKEVEGNGQWRNQVGRWKNQTTKGKATTSGTTSIEVTNTFQPLQTPKEKGVQATKAGQTEGTVMHPSGKS